MSRCSEYQGPEAAAGLGLGAQRSGFLIRCKKRSILKIIWKRFRSFSDTENAMNFKVYQTIFSFENVLRISQTIFSSENYMIVSHSIFSSEKSYDIFQYIFSYWKCYEFSQTVFQLWKSSDNLSAYFQYRKIIWEFLSLFSGSVNYLIFSQLIFSIWKLSDNFQWIFGIWKLSDNFSVVIQYLKIIW